MVENFDVHERFSNKNDFEPVSCFSYYLYNTVIFFILCGRCANMDVKKSVHLNRQD